jgi:hypothetical protein
MEQDRERMPTETESKQNINLTRPRSGGRLSWILLLCASAVMAYYVLFDRVDHTLTSEIQSRLRKQFPEHYIKVDRARLVPGQSILIDGLSICKSTEQGMRDVVKIASVQCNGPIDLIGILQGQTIIDSVLIDGLEVNLWPKADGNWSLSELFRGPAGSVAGERCDQGPCVARDRQGRRASEGARALTRNRD